MTAVAIGFVVLFVLLFLEVPIAFGMGLVGYFGLVYFLDTNAALSVIGNEAFGQILKYDFAVLPLFILMGNFIARSGISNDLYDASNAWVGHTRGGLATATIVACGGFSAVCGSSLATAATMTKVAMPSMRRYGYADSLASGSIAAGGTLGILIPPSVALVFYGIMTDSDIGKLFAAGLLPGILGILLYITAIKVVTRINPELGPKGERTGWRQRFAVLRGVWGILLLFGVVMGGIYFGVFSPTESAGIGAFGALAIGWLNGSLTPQTPRGVGPLITWLISGFRERAALAEFGRFLAAPVRRGRFDWKTIIDVLNESGRTSVAMFSILIGSLIFANFINVSNVPRELADWFLAIKVSPLVVVLIIVAVYIVLGCILESISMMLLTVPVFYPIILALDFGMTQQDALIWFGIVVVVVIEISLITPPIGLNVFVLKTLLPDVPVTRIFRGVLPFIAADVVRTAILIFVPVISLLLTRMM
jgi:TRAP-type C4-dicarboxylate transport system permease large subunit